MNHSLASVALASTFALANLVACSSNGNAPVAPTNQNDAATTPAPESAAEDGMRSADAASGNDAGTCAPVDVSGFKPTYRPSAPFGQKKCTAEQVDALVCLLGPNASSGECQAARNDAANAGCFRCMYTAATAPKLGPILVVDGRGELNGAGCIANLTGESGSGSCAAKYQAMLQCSAKSCAAACPIKSADDLAPYDACVKAAQTGTCDAYGEQATCAGEPFDNGASLLEICYPAGTPDAQAVAMATRFCGDG